MDNISFKLDVFEGPLDLLLHLISKHKLNINDIEISKLLEQYLLYIEQAKEQDLELAGEFLEMAARLIYIKTVSLLPKPEEAEEIKKELLPLVTLITPNIDEAKVLTGKSIHNIQDMQTAAKMLTDDYQTNILLKGGHLEGDNMCDLLHTSEFIYHIYEEKKIESHNLHGTGCTLSSAIATYLAKGYPMRESIQHAKTYITQAIIAGKELNIGHGNGPLWHFPDTVAQMCTFCAVVS